MFPGRRAQLQCAKTYLIGLVPRWEQLRLIGQLQVLKQASIVSVILVPFLASVWPAIRVLLDSFGVAYAELPISLAFAFFGSILILIAQTLYQTRAPEVIRTYSRDQHTQFRLNDFHLNPTPAVIERYRIFVHRDMEKFRHGFRDRVVNKVEMADADFEHSRSFLKDRDTLSQITRLYSESYYDMASRSFAFSRFLAALFYCFGMFCVAQVIIRQCYSVAVESGIFRW